MIHRSAAWGALPLLLVFLLLACEPEAHPGSEDQSARAADSEPGRPAIPSPAELAKLPPDGGPHWNRLVFERSPYLLQHAGNPVDWYPWGDEAFARAQAEDKPLFVSIGYSTCHWCHVMEHESFEDEEVARYLSEHFVCIKVDREERPDIDAVYMAAVQSMTGRGGWPLNVFLLPSGETFFGGTYWPKEDRGGRIGFLSLLGKISEAWATDRTPLLTGSESIMEAVRGQLSSVPGGKLGEPILTQAAATLLSSVDETHGGFGRAPKFPRAHTLSFLLREYARTGDGRLLDAVERTLDGMARGGIHDHLGGGFHRYSVDERWLVPHFEKMLYDQAINARAYLEAFEITGDPRWEAVARGTFSYVLRDLTDERGGFLSAEDADSGGEEGTFYVWTPAEVREVLDGPEEAELFSRVYGVTQTGNFEGGTSILHLSEPIDSTAAELGMSPEKLEERLSADRRRLLEVRAKRVRPGLDDKVLTAWNGLMISSLSYGAQALDAPEYLAAAKRAADFVLAEMRTPEGDLLRRYRQGDASIPGFIDDYAFFANGLLDLYETCFEVRYLEAAVSLTARMNALLWDDENGGYFFRAAQTVGGSEGGPTVESGGGGASPSAPSGAPTLLRSKEIYDGAIPSGNSVAALLLLRLGDLTGDVAYTTRAWDLFGAFAGAVAPQPTAYSQLLIALDYAFGPSIQVVVAGDPSSSGSRAFLRPLQERFLPNLALLVREGGGEGTALARLAPFVEAQTTSPGETTVYVCQDHACSLPTGDVGRMLELLEASRTAGQR